jgi:IS5 family transposase
LAAPEVLPERRLGGGGVVAVLASEDGLATKCALHNSYVDASERQLRAIDIFGWMKAVGGFRRTRFRGLERTQLAGYFVGAAYNLLRIARLVAA